ncbi:hypothetical protein ACIQ2D_01075 [Lysinibacillus sp. NPDC097287]|uniref:hypothetical protein n=1 Tax=Lysinibacillus sp. NPDC097287 TaxID=3364144 RepID=UPI003800F935
MNKLFTYIPIGLLVLVLFGLESSLLKWLLLGIAAVMIVFAKYFRVQMQDEDIEFDERVNANISKWSLRTMIVLNALLILVLFTVYKGLLPMELDIQLLLMYLLLSLFLPFYVVPAIIKKL